jgi:Glycoside-hydrolase family GH114
MAFSTNVLSPSAASLSVLYNTFTLVFVRNFQCEKQTTTKMLLRIVVGGLLASTALGRPADLPNVHGTAANVSVSSTSMTRKPVPKTTFGTQGPSLTLIEGDGSETGKSTAASVTSTPTQSTSTEVEETSSQPLETKSEHTASRTSFGGFGMTPRPRPTGFFGGGGGGGKGRPKAASRTGGFLDGLFGFPRARTSSVVAQPSRARPTAKSTAVSQPEATGGSSRTNGLAGWESKMKNPTFQIILSGVPDLKSNAMSITPNVDIYDIDLFMTETSTIRTLKRLNKTVICYFSAGTYEPGRPDSNKYTAADKGNRLLQWPSERWVKLSSAGVRRIITDRIQLAQQKGCDAIDPDNVGTSPSYKLMFCSAC